MDQTRMYEHIEGWKSDRLIVSDSGAEPLVLLSVDRKSGMARIRMEGTSAVSSCRISALVNAGYKLRKDDRAARACLGWLHSN